MVSYIEVILLILKLVIRKALKWYEMYVNDSGKFPRLNLCSRKTFRIKQDKNKTSINAHKKQLLYYVLYYYVSIHFFITSIIIGTSS